MKTMTVPGWGSAELENLVLDLNGTLTESGDFIPGVIDYLEKMRAEGFRIYVLSGDTREALKQGLEEPADAEAVITRNGDEKRDFVESIGADRTVCVGNGNIDVEMFKAARLSICTIQAEGASLQAMLAADIVVTQINQAFEILLDPSKLIATLRS